MIDNIIIKIKKKKDGLEQMKIISFVNDRILRMGKNNLVSICYIKEDQTVK